ncbi:hypothetical protein Acsp04_58800 [Actinomadura sp. NBRC 104425]|uniref:hypothetical protein n=1 Tax=Actinomadura sp. NBRC 104425 TaxID=3032204 RepID=UPI0024A3264F|nr:hypothetical protein [Actinomadura sp. NBRC 104425]GLZ15645.1 hypothetical protein Acsp04_58800 [Actinomadura sp. NBRC 104425]
MSKDKSAKTSSRTMVVQARDINGGVNDHSVTITGDGATVIKGDHHGTISHTFGGKRR